MKLISIRLVPLKSKWAEPGDPYFEPGVAIAIPDLDGPVHVFVTAGAGADEILWLRTVSTQVQILRTTAAGASVRFLLTPMVWPEVKNVLTTTAAEAAVLERLLSAPVSVRS